MACPKCGHVRAAAADNPAWQCPACGIAYHKFDPTRHGLSASLRPRTAADGRPPLIADASIFSLVAANVVALGIALFSGWQLVDLMAIFWLQSVIIGVSYFFRILSLDKFSTENFQINNRSVEPTEQTKRQTAFFFLAHFGFFHVVYLMFLFAEASAAITFDLGFAACAITFVLNHLYSYRYHRALDQQGTPNIGTMMFTPYVRIIPMHLTIVFGVFALGATGLLVFGVLKILADVAMHVVEHRVLGRGEAAAASDG